MVEFCNRMVLKVIGIDLKAKWVQKHFNRLRILLELKKHLFIKIYFFSKKRKDNFGLI